MVENCYFTLSVRTPLSSLHVGYIWSQLHLASDPEAAHVLGSVVAHSQMASPDLDPVK